MLAGALAHYAARRWAEAEADCRQLLAQHPDNRGAQFLLQTLDNSASSDAHRGLAFALWNAGRFDDALAAFAAAIEADPALAGAYHNYAVALNDLNRLDEALPHYRKAIELEPDYADAHHGLAQIYLARGELEQGWIEYEWRRKLPSATKEHPHLLWRGEPLNGRTIVLLDEQGLGDTIQFVRYAPLVAARGAKVILVCNPALAQLLTMVPGVSQVVPRGRVVRDYDFHWPMLSLALMFKTRLETIPAEVPYLRVPAERVKFWKQELGPKAAMRVGLVWAGNPGYRRDRDRSLAPSLLAPLAQAGTNVTFYSLQKGPVSPHAAGMPPLPLLDLQEQLTDLADTAAAIANLDLVITVDTAVAHLAGALGRPVWVLLPYEAPWRWLLDREDSPWYPTMKLFRQKTRGDWQAVVRRVARELADLARQHRVVEPADSLAHFEHGNRMLRKGRPQQAIAAFRAALELRADFPSCLNNLGTALKEAGRPEEAIDCYLKALALKPDNHAYHYNLGAALSQVGRCQDAAEHYRRAIELKPDFALSHCGLGSALKDLGRLDDAIDAFHEARRLDPNLPSPHYNLGNAMKDAANLDEAVNCFRRALQLNPRDPLCHSNLSYTVHFHPDYDGPAILAENRRWDEIHSRTAERHAGPWPNSPDPSRKLRVGYVGSDFRDHCQSLFTIPLLANHDHGNFEIYCYANVPAADQFTRRTQQLVDRWRSTYQQTDAAVAKQVHADRIDILVDLTMHMGRGRPLLFARQPAPVQVAWLAYPGTTGLSAIAWRLTDPYLDPPGHNDSHYAETSYRLADTFWCYDPLVEEIPIPPLPAQRNGYVTFGCLNNFCKVTPPTIELWSRVLTLVPRSRLVLLAPAGRHRRVLKDKLAHLDIDPDRIAFVDVKPRPEYLKHYHNLDICLDTIPYNGHTTSLDSYWMGVPVVTLVGQTAVGRAGWSQLKNLGLPELAAQAPDEYVAIAQSLAADLPRLSALRAALRDRLKQSPLMDAPRFARNMEAAFRDIWRQWCAAR
jgi:predicted O-linked N-acetylglucosamine transferase (SPINDLY family)